MLVARFPNYGLGWALYGDAVLEQGSVAEAKKKYKHALKLRLPPAEKKRGQDRVGSAQRRQALVRDLRSFEWLSGAFAARAMGRIQCS